MGGCHDVAEWQPESRCWDNFSCIFLDIFLLRVHPLRLTPGSESEVRCHPHQASAWHLPAQGCWEVCDSGRPKHAATPRVCTVRVRRASPTSPAAVREWGEDAVGEGKDLLAQTGALRVAHVGLTPNTGSCWVPESAGKRDWRLGDMTCVCVCAGSPGVEGWQTVTPASPIPVVVRSLAWGECCLIARRWAGSDPGGVGLWGLPGGRASSPRRRSLRICYL